jgi:anaerobic selenocysteine-containing dehydrogenase
MVGNFGPGWGYTKPYGQWCEPLMAPPAGSDVIEEWQVFHGLAERLDKTLSIPPCTILDPKAAAEVATPVAPGAPLTSDDVWAMLLKGSPVPFETLKTAPEGRVFDRPTVVVQEKPADWAGKLEIGSPAMMAELHEIAAAPFGGEDPFPFRVISRRMRDVLNSSWHENDKLKRQFAFNPAFINPDDMAALHLSSGDIVEIESVRAAIRGVAMAAPDVRRGCISMTHAWGGDDGEDHDPRVAGSNTGRLTPVDRDFDRYSGIPRMSAIPVRVRRVEGV